MDKLEELGLKPADVHAITPKEIAETVLDTTRHKTVISQLFQKNMDLTRVKGRSLVLPKFKDNLTVYSDVSAGSSIPASSLSYEGVTVEVSKFGIVVQVDQEALEMAARDLMKDLFRFAGEELADELDKRATTLI